MAARKIPGTTAVSTACTARGQKMAVRASCAHDEKRLRGKFIEFFSLRMQHALPCTHVGAQKIVQSEIAAISRMCCNRRVQPLYLSAAGGGTAGFFDMGVMLRRFMRPRQSAPSGAAWRGRALGINGCSWLLTTQSRRANDAAMAAPRTVSAAGTQSDPAGLPGSAEQGGAQGGPLALTV